MLSEFSVLQIFRLRSTPEACSTISSLLLNLNTDAKVDRIPPAAAMLCILNTAILYIAKHAMEFGHDIRSVDESLLSDHSRKLINLIPWTSGRVKALLC